MGVAVSDPDGRLAVPVETVRRGGSGEDLARVVALAEDHEVVEVVVGLPVSLSGEEGRAAAAAREYARALERRLARHRPGVPVRLVDERLSTVSATRLLRAAGVPSRRSRETVDAAAAAVILQQALDAAAAGERSGVGDPGETPRADRA